MSNYTKSTNFATKDTLPSGNALKIVRGTEIDTEFNNIATAITSKSDSISPTFSGTVTTAALTVNGTATFNGSATFSSIDGNITLSGVSARILGDFSNATIASRAIFQTSTTNGNTTLTAIPNGTSTTANFVATNNSNPTNSAIVSVGAIGTTDVRITSGIFGTGTYLPMTFYTGGAERLRITTDNRFQADFSNATMASRAIFQTSTTNGHTTLTAIPNGTSITANFVATNNSDPTNSAIVSVGAIGTTDVRITSGIFGTGTYLPMTFYVGGAERLRARTDGSLWTDANTQPGFFARAWVNFDGTGTVAIRASANVTSITDNGTGDYTVNFTTSMPDANYCAQITCGSTGIPGYPRLSPANMTTTGVRFNPVNGDNNAVQDMDALQVAIFR